MDMRDPVRRLRYGAALTVLMLAGCASTFDLEPPKLSLVSMKVQSADLFSQRLLVRMQVVNPNARELPIKGIDYRIEVFDSELAHGEASAPFVVPAQGEAEFDVQVTANLASTVARLAARHGSMESLQYRLVGEVSLASGFLRRIPFDERGSVKLK